MERETRTLDDVLAAWPGARLRYDEDGAVSAVELDDDGVTVSYYFRMPAAVDELPYVVERALREVEHAIAERKLPECIVPSCTARGRVEFTATEPGRLAGRVLRRGDKVVVCPEHGNDIFRANPYGSVDDLPAWLRADARLFAPHLVVALELLPGA